MKICSIEQLTDLRFLIYCSNIENLFSHMLIFVKFTHFYAILRHILEWRRKGLLFLMKILCSKKGQQKFSQNWNLNAVFSWTLKNCQNGNPAGKNKENEYCSFFTKMRIPSSSLIFNLLPLLPWKTFQGEYIYCQSLIDILVNKRKNFEHTKLTNDSKRIENIFFVKIISNLLYAIFTYINA